MDKYLNGHLICTKTYHPPKNSPWLYNTSWTEDKVYHIVNGIILNDRDLPHKQFKTIKELTDSLGETARAEFEMWECDKEKE